MARETEEGQVHEKERLYRFSGTRSESTFEEDVDINSPFSQKRQWRLSRWVVPYIIFSSLVIIILILFIISHSIRSKQCDTRRAYSPAQEALVTDIHSFKGSPPDAKAKYVGRPSAALDQAWADLLQYSNIRFTDKEFYTIHPEGPDNAIKLPDGGYFGSLYVYHELHCLKHLYRFVYKEHYLPPLNESESDDLRIHIGHCIDTIRQAVLCHADITPFTMTWPKTYAVPGADITSPHTCASWDSVNNWAMSRSIDNIFEPGYLRHPVFGEVYGKDFEDRINRKTGFTHSS